MSVVSDLIEELNDLKKKIDSYAKEIKNLADKILVSAESDDPIAMISSAQEIKREADSFVRRICSDE